MIGIFMFILFLLNIITIFAVIVLFLRQNRFIQVEKDQKIMISEMEELMTGYLMEMKEENEALLEKIANKKQPLMKKVAEKESSISNETKASLKARTDEEQNLPHVPNSTKNKAVEVYKKQSVNKLQAENLQMDEDSLGVSVSTDIQGNNPEKATFMETLQASLNGQLRQEPTLHEQVNLLAKQGLSAEEIAQQLKCGKTEIELLLKFQNEK